MLLGDFYTKSGGVLRYNRNDIFKWPVQVEPMNIARSGCGCTTFNSPVHNGRSVLIVVETGAKKIGLGLIQQ